MQQTWTISAMLVCCYWVITGETNYLYQMTYLYAVTWKGSCLKKRGTTEEVLILVLFLQTVLHWNDFDSIEDVTLRGHESYTLENFVL